MSDSAEDVAHHVMATGELQRTQIYIEKGRRWQGATVSELRSRFLLWFAEWRASPMSQPAELSDVLAEYALRRAEPPFDEVKDDLNIITRSIADAVSGLPDEERERINSNMIDEVRSTTKMGH